MKLLGAAKGVSSGEGPGAPSTNEIRSLATRGVLELTSRILASATLLLKDVSPLSEGLSCRAKPKSRKNIDF